MSLSHNMKLNFTLHFRAPDLERAELVHAQMAQLQSFLMDAAVTQLKPIVGDMGGTGGRCEIETTDLDGLLYQVAARNKYVFPDHPAGDNQVRVFDDKALAVRGETRKASEFDQRWKHALKNAIARGKGENMDGTPRRETVAVKPPNSNEYWVKGNPGYPLYSCLTDFYMDYIDGRASIAKADAEVRKFWNVYKGRTGTGATRDARAPLYYDVAQWISYLGLHSERYHLADAFWMHWVNHN
jgi:hypothetical protein